MATRRQILFVTAAFSTMEVWAHDMPMLHMALSSTKPPYVFPETLSGLEYDLLKRILLEMGYQLKPQFVPNSRMHYLFENRQVDSIASVRLAPEGLGYSSKPYIVYHNAAMSLTAKHLHIDKIEDLAHFTITSFQTARINLGSVYEATVARSPYYIEVSSQVIQNRLLYSHRVEVAVGDPMIFRYADQEAGSLVDAAQPVTTHLIFPPSPYVAVFQTAGLRDQFNIALRKIQASDFYKQLADKYLIPISISGKVSFKPDDH